MDSRIKNCDEVREKVKFLDLRLGLGEKYIIFQIFFAYIKKKSRLIVEKILYNKYH